MPPGCNTEFQEDGIQAGLGTANSMTSSLWQSLWTHYSMLFQACGSWVGYCTLILGVELLVRSCETVPQTPGSWSSWWRKAAQPGSTFWAMEGFCREPWNVVLYVTEQEQQAGSVLTTELCVEGQVMRGNYSPKQALSNLHWPSSAWSY